MLKKSTFWGILFVDYLKPLLFWLHRDVPAQWAPSYYRAVHEFVYHWPTENRSGYHHLISGSETLLRIFCLDPVFVSIRGQGYCKNKFTNSVDDYQEYFKGVGYPLFSPELNIKELLSFDSVTLLEHCLHHFQEWEKRLAAVHSEHFDWVKFNGAMLAHLTELEKAGQFLDVDREIKDSLYSMISRLLASGFSLVLPSETDDTIDDLHAWCQVAWQNEYGKVE